MVRDGRITYLMQDLMSDYLLGKLSEPERERLEDQLFEDDDLFAAMLASEDCLIADYLDGNLTPDENERFTGYFLSSVENRRKLELQKELRTSDSEASRVAPKEGTEEKLSSGIILSSLFRGWRIAFATACLAVFAVAFWLAWPGSHPEQSAALQEPGNTSTPAVNEAPVPREAAQSQPDNKGTQPSGNEVPANRNPNSSRKPTVPNPTLATLLLTPGSTRGGAGSRTELHLAPGVRTVVLKLSFDGRTYSMFDVVIQTPEGRSIWQRSGIRAAKPVSSLSVTLPANTLSPEDHILTLSGRDADGRTQKLEEYFFSVEKP
ncbi:MAG: zf-HC2 domain-containing protein [Acidobacteria bacterium]|nr:zf-HC2 domain-containing protein [Acidobacteriota bacterium]